MNLIDLLARMLAGDRPSSAELPAMVAHISQAEFISDESLSTHLAKRIAEGQWRSELTRADLLDDPADRSRARMLGLYERRGGVIAVLIADRGRVVLGDHIGGDPEVNAIVVCSADRGKGISVYQFSELRELAAPEDALWFKLTPPQ